MKTNRGEIATTLLVVLGLCGVGIGAAWFGPKLWGNSKRAKQSTEATAQLEAAVQARVAADQARHASAAAGVATIGRAAADLPESPATEFVRAEVPAVLAKLPAPDPVALLEAERRRVAFMEGQRDFARSLYAAESARSSELLKQVTQKEAALQAAIAERQAADLAIEKAAAAELAERRQKFVLVAVVVLLVAFWIWTKVNGLSMATVGKLTADLREGKLNPVDVVEKYVPVRLWPTVNKHAKLNTALQDSPQPVRPVAE